jgi:hypothetical protein
MYEIGKAPESEAHPDHGLAMEIARGLWAELSVLDLASVARMLARGRGLDPASDEAAALVRDLDSEAMRAALARIACGYDGGQI